MSLAARSVPFGSKPMKQVRRSDVEAWIKSMHAAGLAPGTIKTRYVNVRSVFRAAVKDKVIGSDPTDGVRLPRNRRADVAMSIPTPQEVGQLIAVADERFQPFIALCAFAGLRLGEAAGIQLGDVDFLRKSLKVSRQVQRVNGGAIELLPAQNVHMWPIERQHSALGRGEFVRSPMGGTATSRQASRQLPALPHHSTAPG